MKPSKRKRIVLGMDGGLPSRVAASILRNQDFDLLAVHLRCDLAALGLNPATYPSAMGASDLPAIEKFCESLGIPLRMIDVTEEVLAKVHNPFWIATLTGTRFSGAAAWAKEILFPHLERVATARGADQIGTGHFAKRAPDLYRYPEGDFDQSRTLAQLDRALLEKLVLPVGDVSLEMLIRLAREIGAIPKTEAGFSLEAEMRALATARKTRGRWEWTDAQLEAPEVQARAAGDYFAPGPIRGTAEFEVGNHRGIPFYQVGSKAPQSPGHFVLKILPQSRTLLVAAEAGMAVDTIRGTQLVWTDALPHGAHRRRFVTIEKEAAHPRIVRLGPDQTSGTLLTYPGGLAELQLDAPLYAVSPGETLVFFEDSRVLGSLKVIEALRSGTLEKPIEKQGTPA